MSAPVYRKPADLPDTIPVFPLGGAVLLPRGELPLNIFEPRYLNMIDDVFAGARIIGMVQPKGENDAGPPPICTVGCAGRVTSYSETSDGRYLITLTGVSRFRVTEELAPATPYRQVKADFEPYAADLEPATPPAGFDRTELVDALRAYLDANGMRAEWSAVESAPAETLVNSLCMICPFEPPEKQALLEAETLDERRDALITLMRMGAAKPHADGEGGLQ